MFRLPRTDNHGSKFWGKCLQVNFDLQRKRVYFSSFISSCRGYKVALKLYYPASLLKWRSMKKILILVLGIAMASGTIFAGDEQGKQGDGDRMARMQQNLGLSDEQIAQIRQIRDNGGGKEEILSVLTDEQLALMKKRRAQMKGKGRKGDRPAPSGDVQKSEITDS
jgi:hypothetical protein